MENYLPKIKKSVLIEKIKITSSLEEIYSVFSEEPDTAFLNSSLKTDVGRYSFIGLNPFLTIKTTNNSIDLIKSTGTHSLRMDPFTLLEKVFDFYKTDTGTTLPFTSGGIGYFSYDLKNVLEKLPSNAKNDLNLPDIYFILYQIILLHDKEEPENLYICITDIDEPEHKNGSALVEEIKDKLNDTNKSTETISKSTVKSDLTSNFTKDAYMDAIKKTIEYIKAGDIYQACLSQRFETKWTKDPYDLYLKLNNINPAPFSAYLNYPEAKIISSSPELFIRVQDSKMETRPMKGTRRRGENNTEDIELKNDLLNSQKDSSELSMIVDLERNDLGKIAIPGSVKVSKHRRIETYPTVFQSISIVESEIKKGINPAKILKAVFPGGSITGCPKIRAMEIIDEIEPTARGVYTGSIGYISFHNTMDLNIAIRTMIYKDKKVYFQAGGGIVADSNPEMEYQETLHKAKALMDSLK